ncbi:MAG: transposase [Rhodospirillales bacterium]|nr:transposase [Rhodospirillales bacterium]
MCGGQTITRHARRPAPSRRGDHEDLPDRDRTSPARGGRRDPRYRHAESRPRLGGISFLHRFGSALNHHVHLHVYVTDGVFAPNHPLRPAVTAPRSGTLASSAMP